MLVDAKMLYVSSWLCVPQTYHRQLNNTSFLFNLPLLTSTSRRSKHIDGTCDRRVRHSEKRSRNNTCFDSHFIGVLNPDLLVYFLYLFGCSFFSKNHLTQSPVILHFKALATITKSKMFTTPSAFRSGPTLMKSSPKALATITKSKIFTTPSKFISSR